MSTICAKWFLELNCSWKIPTIQLFMLNVHERYLQFIVSDSFRFYKNQCTDYFNEAFCLVDDNGVAMRFYYKKLKWPFRKSKLGMQSLSYVGPSTWNELPNNLKTPANINCLQQDIKKYFPKKLSETETVIYSYNYRKALRVTA